MFKSLELMDAFRPMKYYINSDRVTSIKIIECAMQRIRRASEKEKSNEKLYSNGNGMGDYNGE